MADVGTSSVAYATRQLTGTIVFIGDDGIVVVLFCDGTNQKFAYAASPYSSWTLTTLVTGLNMGLGAKKRAGSDTAIDVVTGASGTVRGNYYPLTKSGGVWSVGAPTAIMSTTVLGPTATGCILSYAGQDAQGRHWIVFNSSTSYTAARAYYSAANTPAGAWTSSVNITETADGNLPAGDQVGNFILEIHWNGTALQFQRADNHLSSIGSWSTTATISNLGGSPNASSVVCFRGISATQGVLTYSTGSGIYAQTYDPVGNTWSAATQLSSGANDRHPTIVTDGAGNAWVLWCSYVGANNYALLYKKWNGSTWDSSPTTLVASGTNIAYPNGGYNNNVVGVTYTQGTSNPYTVGWVTFIIPKTRTVTAGASLYAEKTRTITATASLSYPPGLVFYGSAVADATFTNACDMAGATGGAETSKTTTVSGAGNIYEITSQGKSVTCVGALPAPTGNGWVFFPGAGSFMTGIWSPVAYLSALNWSPTHTTITIRFYRLPLGVLANAVLIGSIDIACIDKVKTLYTWTPTSFTGVTFADTDVGYTDMWANDTSTGAGDNPVVYLSTTAANGVGNDLQVTTSAFVVAPKTRTITASTALLTEKTRTVTASVALLLEQTRTIPSTVATILTNVKTIPASVATFVSPTRTVTADVAFLRSGTRTITTSAALLLEKTRTVAASSALLLEKTRTVTATVAVLQPTTRTISASVALLQPTTRTITASASLQALRTVPTSVSVAFLDSTRSVPSTVALQQTAIRTIASSVTLGGATMRAITASVALLSEQTRTITASGALSAIRVISTSVALAVLNATRTIPGDTSLVSFDLTRTIPTTLALIKENTRSVTIGVALVAAQTRDINATLAVRATSTRTLPVDTALQVCLTRTIPAGSAMSTTNARTVAATSALLQETTRTITATASFSQVGEAFCEIPASVALLQTRTRTVALSSALGHLDQARTIAASVAIQQTKGREVDADVAVSQTTHAVIIASVTLYNTSTQTVIASVAFIGEQRTIVPVTGALIQHDINRGIPITVALYFQLSRHILCSVSLIAVNARATMRSGDAITSVRRGEAHTQVRSGQATTSVRTGDAIAHVRSGEATTFIREQ